MTGKGEAQTRKLVRNLKIRIVKGNQKRMRKCDIENWDFFSFVWSFSASRKYVHIFIQSNWKTDIPSNWIHKSSTWKSSSLIQTKNSFTPSLQKFSQNCDEFRPSHLLHALDTRHPTMINNLCGWMCCSREDDDKIPFSTPNLHPHERD